MLYANPRSFGGFIWDFIDQGLRRGNSQYFNFGGLWGDRPMMIISVLTALFFPIELYNLNYGKSNTNTAIYCQRCGCFWRHCISRSRFDFTNIGDEVDLVWTLKKMERHRNRDCFGNILKYFAIK